MREPPHYLKQLSSDTLPTRLLWLDCGAQTTREGGAFVDRWNVGALGRTWWTSKRGEQRDQLDVFTRPDDLWESAADFCRPGKRVVLFAYDLAYQLRIGQGLVHLPNAGWRLDRIVLERTAAWCLLRQGKRSLMCCDLKSWIPGALELISTECDWRRSVMSPPARIRLDQETRAQANAEAVRLAVLALFDWIRAERLGPFRPTGSGQSYSAFRRRFLHHKLLVHDDVDRLALERRAMWTGRCEAWRHGKQHPGPFVEYDLSAAYCRIAAECSPPGIAWRILKRPNLQRTLDLTAEYAVLAEVEIDTDTEAVPTQLGGRTVWPVGRFRTVLWDPELQLAARTANSVKVERAFLYHRTIALQPFAHWVLDVMAGSMAQYGPLPARVAKHWSRSLVGRLGLRFRQWQQFATMEDPDLQLIDYLDVDTGESTQLLMAGRDALILTDLAEGRDSLPQIPGWVMAECRRRLWDAMDSAGRHRVTYIDTDSMILGPARGYSDQLQDSALAGAGWAVRGRYDAMMIYGPRNYRTEAGRKVSGLPLSARQVAPLEFTGQVMRSIRESMKTGALDHVASIPRKFVLDAADLRRQHAPDGSTVPYRIEMSRES